MSVKFLDKIDPVSFGYVMATGTLSTALHFLQWSILSEIFLYLAALGYLILVVLFGARLILMPKQVFQEDINPLTLLKYFTFCAGTNTLAARLVFAGDTFAALMLGIVGIAATIILIYSLFVMLFFHFSLYIQEVSPFWLLMAIAGHSSGIVLSSLWIAGVLSNPLILLLAFGIWTFCVFIYIIFMTLNIYRMFFFPFEGKDLNPAYWTCMGAAAIAVLDGSLLILAKNAPAAIETLKPFVSGMVIVLWVWATAWIPILCLMGIWKYAYFKIPFHYHASLWAMVFPLGMYTLATKMIGSSVHLDLVQGLVPAFLWITLAVWLGVLLKSRGMLWLNRGNS